MVEPFEADFRGSSHKLRVVEFVVAYDASDTIAGNCEVAILS